jgi:hypothetical protein
MLTPLLERLLCEGKAQAGVYNGAFDSSCMEIPKGKFVIIHHLEVFPYASVAVSDDFYDERLVMNQIIHTMRVGSSKANNYFTFRNEIRAIYSDTVKLNFYLPVGTVNIDTWITAQTRVFFEFANNNSIDNWLQPLPAPYPEVYDNLKPPLGYGTKGNGGTNTQRSMGLGDVDNTSIYPRGIKSFPGLAGVSGKLEFNMPFNVDTQLNPPIIDDPKGIYSFPVYNVSYLLIDGNPTDVFKQSF